MVASVFIITETETTYPRTVNFSRSVLVFSTLHPVILYIGELDNVPTVIPGEG